MKYITFLLLFVFTANTLTAQSNDAKPFILGKTEILYSNTLSEKRILNIYLPEGYDTAVHTHYPVIYVLDGSANEDFIHTAGLVQYLSMYEMMPKSIVVGIANVDRRRDYTFPSHNPDDAKLVPVSGGSAKFITFIEKELQPFIERYYRTSERKTIIGQSLGGLVASEILLKKPALFTDYMIVSPSLWWDRESLLNAAPDLVKNLPENDMKVYVSVGKEGEQMEGDVKKFIGILNNTGRENFRLFHTYMDKETHLTILHNALYKGFVMMNGE